MASEVAYFVLTAEWCERYRETRLASLREFPEAFGANYAEQVLLPELYSEQFIRNPQDEVLLMGARRGEELIGIVALICTDPAALDEAEIMQVYVKSSEQGRGIATALFKALLQEAKARDQVKTIRLAVKRHNKAAIRLYQSLGWQRVDPYRHEGHGADDEYYYAQSIDQLGND